MPNAAQGLSTPKPHPHQSEYTKNVQSTQFAKIKTVTKSRVSWNYITWPQQLRAGLAPNSRKVTARVLVVGAGGVEGGVGVGINCTDLHRAFRAKSCRLCNPTVGSALLLGRMQYTGDRRCTRYYAYCKRGIRHKCLEWTHGVFKITYISRLTTGIRSEKCVVRRFRRCANVYLHRPRKAIATQW